MRILYHYPLCPFSRKVRFALSEKKLDFAVEQENFWEKRTEFLQINSLGQVPVMIDMNGSELSDSTAIVEYLDEVYPEKKLIGEDILVKTETRKIMNFFDTKFATEVSLALLNEKVIKRFSGKGGEFPDSKNIRNAKNSMHHYLDYISWLSDRRNWLSGENFSMADITVASHLSVVDYLGDVPWDRHEPAKQWYARVKSRPAFRSFFQDRIAGLIPPSHYSDLDF
jgi:glutathione S-transferase